MNEKERVNTFVAVQRIQDVLKVNTQTAVAQRLGVSQSSVSCAVKSGTFPDSWKITLIMKYGVNPDWVITGRGNKYFVPPKKVFNEQGENEWTKEL